MWLPQRDRNRGTRWLIPSRTHLQLMAPTRPHTACHQLWHPALARHQCTAPLLRAMAAWPGPTEVTLEIAESPGHVQTPPPHQQLSPACLTPRARLQEGPPPAARPPHGGSQTQIALVLIITKHQLWSHPDLPRRPAGSNHHPHHLCRHHVPPPACPPAACPAPACCHPQPPAGGHHQQQQPHPLLPHSVLPHHHHHHHPLPHRLHCPG